VSNGMAEKSLVRRSISKDDPRYLFDYAAHSPEELKAIARLAWINAAKINVAPIAPAQLLAISAAIKRTPKAIVATDEKPGAS
jgi:hypothetical protein